MSSTSAARGKTASDGAWHFTIGVDIGGSAIKFAVVDQAGSIVWPPGRPGHGGAAARVGYRVATPGVALLAWQTTGEEELVTYDVADGRQPDANGLVDGKWVVPAAVAQAALKKVLQPGCRRFRHACGGGRASVQPA